MSQPPRFRVHFIEPPAAIMAYALFHPKASARNAARLSLGFYVGLKLLHAFLTEAAPTATQWAGRSARPSRGAQP